LVTLNSDLHFQPVNDEGTIRYRLFSKRQ